MISIRDAHPMIPIVALAFLGAVIGSAFRLAHVTYFGGRQFSDAGYIMLGIVVVPAIVLSIVVLYRRVRGILNRRNRP